LWVVSVRLAEKCKSLSERWQKLWDRIISDRQIFHRYIAVGLILVITIAGLGAWPASYAIGGETSSLRLRAKSQGLGWFANSAGSAVFSAFLPYLYNTDAANLGGKTGFVFCALSAIACVLSYLYVPDLKGLTPAQADEMFESGQPARNFKKQQADVEATEL
jgi:hypothetical protein